MIRPFLITMSNVSSEAVAEKVSRPHNTPKAHGSRQKFDGSNILIFNLLVAKRTGAHQPDGPSPAVRLNTTRPADSRTLSRLFIEVSGDA